MHLGTALSGKCIVNLPNPVRNSLAIVFQLLSRNFYPKLVCHAMNKYGKIQTYACETLVHVKLHCVVSDSYLE